MTTAEYCVTQTEHYHVNDRNVQPLTSLLNSTDDSMMLTAVSADKGHGQLWTASLSALTHDRQVELIGFSIARDT